MAHGVYLAPAPALALGDPDRPLSVTALATLAHAPAAPATEPRLALHPVAAARVDHAAAIVQEIVESHRVVYGINTGFGAFKDRVIPLADLTRLQANLITSQTVGVGPPLAREEVRALMIARAQTLSLGYSGLRQSTLQLLIAMINCGVHPVIPQQGSVGASGDLAPLSHMAQVMTGGGEAEYGGVTLPARQALQAAGLEPVTLIAKEGLAICNGTSQISGLLALATHDATILTLAADICGALSFEALEGIVDALDPRIHAARGQTGQIAASAHLRALIAGSELVWHGGSRLDGVDAAGTGAAPPVAHKVQDAYALRCMAQVHGPARDTLAFVRGIVEIELNAAVDNPLIFGAGVVGYEDGPAVISGGNFHGMPVAVAADVLGIPFCAVASISERRQARLVDIHAHGGLLPPFLIADGGLNSGFMMVQYSAAALVSENKSLAHPASVDSIPTSANQEDHVSMGPIAARHARAILRNTQLVLAMELLTAGQAIDLRRLAAGRPLRLGRGTQVAYALLREQVPYRTADAPFTADIAWADELIRSGRLVREVAAALAE
ncbi:MAG TPA: histidine ammonia-lyase [Chloroflexia bacterium]|nr:histidine ammonia-lyase [Chloroflexia bacterium]